MSGPMLMQGMQTAQQFILHGFYVFISATCMDFDEWMIGELVVGVPITPIHVAAYLSHDEVFRILVYEEFIADFGAELHEAVEGVFGAEVCGAQGVDVAWVDVVGREEHAFWHHGKVETPVVGEKGFAATIVDALDEPDVVLGPVAVEELLLGHALVFETTDAGA